MFLIFAAAAQLATSGASAPTPRAPLQNYVTREDFPVEVERSAARAVSMALTVGPDGRITQCTINASSGNATLDSATCRLLRSRSRFVPARDAAGKFVAGEVRATIDWLTTLSDAEPPLVRSQTLNSQYRVPQGPWESISRLRFRAGQVASCQWRSTVPMPPPPSSNACQSAGLAGMALRMAAENKVDFDKSEVVVTLRMPDGAIIPPLPAAPAALVDLAADLDIAADGRLINCRFTREVVRTSAPQRPDCRTVFAGPYGRATNRSGEAIATKRTAELRVEAR